MPPAAATAAPPPLVCQAIATSDSEASRSWLPAPLLHAHVQLTEALGLEVRQDAGDGKGRGVFATQVRRVCCTLCRGLFPS